MPLTPTLTASVSRLVGESAVLPPRRRQDAAFLFCPVPSCAAQQPRPRGLLTKLQEEGSKTNRSLEPLGIADLFTFDCIYRCLYLAAACTGHCCTRHWPSG
jgi:hypothetical protein